MGCPGINLAIDAALLVGAGGHLALDPTHPGNHSVEIAEDVLRRGPAAERPCGGFFQAIFDRFPLLLDREAGGVDVLPEELEREPEEGLFL